MEFKIGDIVSYEFYPEEQFQLKPSKPECLYPVSLEHKGLDISFTSDGRLLEIHKHPRLNLIRRPSREEVQVFLQMLEDKAKYNVRK